MTKSKGKAKSIKYRDLIPTVIHELKTPITTIKEALNLIEEINGPKFDSQSKRIFSIAAEELDRLLQMVNNLLKISAMEENGLKLKKEPCKLEEIIEDVLRSYKLLIDKKHLTIQTIFALNSPQVLVDRNWMFDAISNIIDNSVKFTPENGQIIIITQIVNGQNQEIKKLKLSSYQRYLKTTIADTGPGIPIKDLSRIFEKFERGSNLSSSTAKGIGLGLAITKNIIEMHNGKIWAESNQGAKFSFVLPVNTR
jgi:two-component system sensor histidine kinase VicK